MAELNDYIPWKYPLRWQAPFGEIDRHIEKDLPKQALLDQELPPADYMLLVDILREVLNDENIEEKPFFVYVLKCEAPNNRKKAERLSNILADYKDDTHGWLDDVYKKREVFYVGATDNPYKRIWEHLKQDITTSAHFTTICKATHLCKLESDFSTRDEAEEREKEIRTEINRLGGEGSRRAFAYSELKDEALWEDKNLGATISKENREMYEYEDQREKKDISEELKWDGDYIPDEWKNST